MLILGVGDGVDAGAALILDDKLVAAETQERHDQVRRSRTFPWQAVNAVLQETGVRERDVDLIAVAGRFSPPFFLRRHPGLRRVARDAFSPAVDAQVFFQAMLRQTGFGAMEADRAAEWLDKSFRRHGFAPQRTITVDVHKALAEGAYRCQPDDDVLVVTLHPMGDGVAATVHRAKAGQVDRRWEQRGFSSLHVHQQRCIQAVGFRHLLDDHRLWAAAGRGTPDEALLEQLQLELRAEGPRLSRRSYPVPALRGRGVYQALSSAERDTAAASVYENLRRAVTDMVRYHVEALGCSTVALAGAVFDNPRLCADIADLEEVDRVWVQPTPGWAGLPIGAALSLGGPPSRLSPAVGLGRMYDKRQCARALRAADVASPEAVEDAAGRSAEVLGAGQALVRFSGPAGWGRFGGGSRSVLVRADDYEAVARVRKALNVRDGDEVGVAWIDTPEDGEVLNRNALAGPLRYGSAAVRVNQRFADAYSPVVTTDGRAHLRIVDESDRELFELLAALRRDTGCAAVAVFSLGLGDDPVAAAPSEAVGVWRQTGIRALHLGPYFVTQ